MLNTIKYKILIPHYYLKCFTISPTAVPPKQLQIIIEPPAMPNYRCNILLFYAFTCRSSNKSRPREAKISDSNLSVHKILLQYHVGAHFRRFCLFCVRSNNFFITICPCRFADFSSNFWSSFRHTSSYWFPLLHDLQEMLLLVFVFLFLYNPRLDFNAFSSRSYRLYDK